MDALTLRRYKGFRMPDYPEMNRMGKTAGPDKTAQAEKTAVPAKVQENLRQLMNQVGRLEAQLRQSHRTLQTGEAVLDEVQDSLERMAKLAEQALSGGDPDVLQKELETLRDEIGRMLGDASANGEKLFLDGGAETIAETTAENAGPAAQSLPDWLVDGLTKGSSMSTDQLLYSLGLDKTADGQEILSAVTNSSLEKNPAVGYMAALYLGSVIAGNSENPDSASALQGLELLFEQVAEGVPLAEAIETLTDGAFSGMADFVSQFMDGSAPGMESFLSGLLLDGAVSLLPEDFSALEFLANLEGGMDLDLLLMPSLLDMLPASSGTDAAAVQQADTAQQETQSTASAGTAAVDPAPAGTAAEASAASGGSTAEIQTAQFGAVQVLGKDLSGVTYDAAKQILTVSGTADITVRGSGQDDPSIVLNGSGTVTLRGVHLPVLTVGNAAARIAGIGGNVVGELRFLQDASLTFSGGRLEAGSLHRTGGANTLYLTGGAVVPRLKADGTFQTWNIPVVVDGPASFAAHAASVTSSGGKTLEPFDIIWKTLLPGWDSISSLALDGKQTKTDLLSDQHPARLWINKGDTGSPLHSVVIKGRDQSGKPQTRYAYLRWDQRENNFEETAMYPNPFRVTGGEEHRDWLYESESHTLRILTGKVTAISGGTGTDANEEPFSGRIALRDYLGAVSLTLDGVVCRVTAGRAFSLGQGNDVTLVLKSGFDNCFESGPGYAGISVSDGALLCIDCAAPHSSRDPAGTLTASGGRGGAGIGRDGRGSRDRTSRIHIRGGVITASGGPGGAGIGAGRRSAMGEILITGGTVTASGQGGGAGIGGALNAPVGDIRIEGGVITATASEHAAAIGAGVQGESGNILITGHARIKKAIGGDPGADIGSCLFGGCGDVEIAEGADIGCARLHRRNGVHLRIGEDAVTLPQFRLSVPSLKLDRLSVLTKEYAQNAISTLDTDRRWVAQIQDMYDTLYNQIEQSRLHNTRQYVSVTRLRDSVAASTLLKNVSQTVPPRVHSYQSERDVRRLFQ